MPVVSAHGNLSKKNEKAASAHGHSINTSAPKSIRGKEESKAHTALIIIIVVLFSPHSILMTIGNNFSLTWHEIWCFC